ncbi:MAG: DUF692 domain-containing protein [Pseudobacteriovorax sp.]|nr:DUF692 domain-containing protein [Pseudobacteriovorax sp.]
MRTEHLDSALNCANTLGLVQVVGDNWLEPGPHHDKLERLRQDAALSFHFVGMNIAGEDPLDLSYLKRILSLIHRYQPSRVSDHLSVQVHQGFYFHDLLPFPRTEASLARIIERVDGIQETLGRRILVENLSAYHQFPESDVEECDFLSAMHQATNCGILLDLNNLKINHLNGGTSPTHFIRRIPVHAVEEIHIAGGVQSGRFWIDDHGSYPSIDTINLAKKPMFASTPIFYERDENLIPWHQFYEECLNLNSAILGKVESPLPGRDSQNELHI